MSPRLALPYFSPPRPTSPTQPCPVPSHPALPNLTLPFCRVDAPQIHLAPPCSVPSLPSPPHPTLPCPPLPTSPYRCTLLHCVDIPTIPLALALPHPAHPTPSRPLPAPPRPAPPGPAPPCGRTARPPRVRCCHLKRNCRYQRTRLHDKSTLQLF